MSDEHFVITGGMGCVGAWVIRNLVQSRVPVTVFDLSTDGHRFELTMPSDEIGQAHYVQGDLTNTDAVGQAVSASGATHVIHLAALQVPFCRENPPLGAAVNVVGTVNMFEAVKRRRERLRHVVYVSSAAIFRAADARREGERTPPDTPHRVLQGANAGHAPP